MKVHYDKTVDAVYLELLSAEPEGVIEVAEGINIDITADGKIVGIELLDAMQKLSLSTFLSYEIEPESIADFSLASADALIKKNAA